MSQVLQFDFPYDGPFGDEMLDQLGDLARSIAEEPGLIWKIWTVNEEAQEAGGIYLFEDAASAQTYLEMHTARLEQFGFQNIRARSFEVHEGLTGITGGPVKS